MSEFLGGTGCSCLESIFKALCAGESATDLMAEFEQGCESLSGDEIEALFHKLQQEGVPFNSNPDVAEFYHTVVTEKLSAHQILQYAPGHPVRAYLQENQLIRELFAKINRIDPQQDLDAFTALFEQIGTVEKHYVRKENQLFPCLEQHGWDSPSTNMWALHDEIRDKIRSLRHSLEAGELELLLGKSEAMQQQMLHLIAVEEQRLLPNAMNLLEESEWVDMGVGDAEIGWMLDREYPRYGEVADEVEPETKSVPEEVVSEETDYVHPSKVSKRGKLHIDTSEMYHYDEGYLTPEQVNLMLKVLPLDITYVDEHDRVVFYNRGDDRLFPRSANIIGREVRFCHPPKSVDTVLRILEEFKKGTQDVADFRIHVKGRYVLIRYFAVRDEQKQYRGVIEMSQDITDITTMEGEQRLLDWD